MNTPSFYQQKRQKMDLNPIKPVKNFILTLLVHQKNI
ncbi:hypothetical protein VPAL9027_02572 [Vibrio palustris]|uniref:Uncharacterized protein n=1 Tax=Vibrio palustris TaxID=1918946 RepID=A0A1R4B6T6_9VIBR|nr:hypothetical protein VPAL9027_02572 [Vibrio palustris]